MIWCTTSYVMRGPEILGHQNILTLRYVTLNYVSLHYSTLHYIGYLPYIPFHSMPFHAMPCHAITLHYITFALHTIPLHTITYHDLPLHTLHAITHLFRVVWPWCLMRVSIEIIVFLTFWICFLILKPCMDVYRSCTVLYWKVAFWKQFENNIYSLYNKALLHTLRSFAWSCHYLLWGSAGRC